MISIECQTAAELEEEEAILGTGASSLDLGVDLNSSFRMGRWITDKDKIRDLRPTDSRLLVDMTFILNQEESSFLTEVTEQDFQKTDNAVAPPTFGPSSFMNPSSTVSTHPAPVPATGHRV